VRLFVVIYHFVALILLYHIPIYVRCRAFTFFCRFRTTFTGLHCVWFSRCSGLLRDCVNVQRLRSSRWFARFCVCAFRYTLLRYAFYRFPLSVVDTRLCWHVYCGFAFVYVCGLQDCVLRIFAFAFAHLRLRWLLRYSYVRFYRAFISCCYIATFVSTFACGVSFLYGRLRFCRFTLRTFALRYIWFAFPTCLPR